MKKYEHSSPACTAPPAANRKVGNIKNLKNGCQLARAVVTANQTFAAIITTA